MEKVEFELSYEEWGVFGEAKGEGSRAHEQIKRHGPGVCVSGKLLVREGYNFGHLDGG